MSVWPMGQAENFSGNSYEPAPTFPLLKQVTSRLLEAPGNAQGHGGGVTPLATNLGRSEKNLNESELVCRGSFVSFFLLVF